MSERISRGFTGAVAQYYARHRRGYPPEVIDVLSRTFGLQAHDTVIDVGCGTGQLTLPLAARVGAVIGIDPEPDMLRLAADAAREADAGNVSWVLGFDSDLPTIGEAVGRGSVAAITVATAIHWMDHDALLRAARPLLRGGGGVAIVANGAPLWLQDADWSRALRGVLAEWTGREPSSSCGTDDRARASYRAAMSAAGFAPAEVRVDYDAPLDADGVVGGVLSAMPVADVADPGRRGILSDRVRTALAPYGTITEHVSVMVQTGVL